MLRYQGSTPAYGLFFAFSGIRESELEDGRAARIQRIARSCYPPGITLPR